MQKQFQYKNATISYTLVGSGQPVVLLHGFGEDSRIFNEQLEFLKEHCLLIIPDLPGSGLSSILPFDAGIDDYAHCIKSLLEFENIASCVILGHSMGGYIALAFAEAYPQMIRGLGLIHSTAFADGEEKKVLRRKAILFMQDKGAFAFLKTSIPNLFSKKFREAFPERIESLIEDSRQLSTEVCCQYYYAMINRPDRTNVLKSNLLPVLFVIGTEDMAVPMDDIVKQVHLPGCSYIHILENTAHMGIWEATAQVNLYLLDFIKQVTTLAP